MTVIRTTLSCLLATLVLAGNAAAHVTLNPGEWEAAGFARFAVRVPNERDNAATTRVTLQFPESVISAGFEPEPGWKRTIEMAPLDAPIEEEGEEPITERLASVTWSGGRIEPGEFVEFGVSFQVPETPGADLLFPSLQTYSNGEVVRWIASDPEAEAPAPRVTVLPPDEEQPSASGGGDDAGQALEATASAAAESAEEADAASSRANLALGVGAAGLLTGLAALGLSMIRSR